MPTKIVLDDDTFPDGRDIPEAGLTGVKHGDTIEVDSDLAERLLEQDIWRRPQAKPKAEKQADEKDGE